MKQKRKQKRLTIHQWNEIDELLTNGEYVKKVCEKYHISRTSVYSYARNHNLYEKWNLNNKKVKNEQSLKSRWFSWLKLKKS